MTLASTHSHRGRPTASRGSKSASPTSSARSRRAGSTCTSMFGARGEGLLLLLHWRDMTRHATHPPLSVEAHCRRSGAPVVELSEASVIELRERPKAASVQVTRRHADISTECYKPYLRSGTTNDTGGRPHSLGSHCSRCASTCLAPKLASGSSARSSGSGTHTTGRASAHARCPFPAQTYHSCRP